MARKLLKGYYVKGQFVAEGSELDIELKKELKGTDEQSRTDLKKESTELQKLGEALMEINAPRLAALVLAETVSEKLADALAEAKRITNFEGKRRQMQFVGKLMRGLSADQLVAIRQAVQDQHSGSAADTLRLHQAQDWRDRLIADDAAFEAWLDTFPQTDTQQLRALIRQARKDAKPEKPGLAPRHGRAFREIFQLVKTAMDDATDQAKDDNDA